MIHALAIVMLVLGVGIEAFAVLGLCVLRDLFDRLHCVSLSSYGVLLIGLAILLRQSFSLLGDKALLCGLLLVGLSPVVVHTTARSFRVRLWNDWRARPAELREERR